MPPIEQTSLVQRAVLWRNLFEYDANGQEVYATPVQINVRWCDAENNALSPEQNQIDLSQDIVVPYYVPPKSRMWLDPHAKPNLVTWKGAVADWFEYGINKVPSDLCWVRVSTNIPDVKAQFFFRSVKLQRLADTLNVG
jgi:hypothetical protein